MRIEVWDQGEGIPADQLKTIFGEFQQLGHPARSRHQGLGLAIARLLIQTPLVDSMTGNPAALFSNEQFGLLLLAALVCVDAAWVKKTAAGQIDRSRYLSQQFHVAGPFPVQLRYGTEKCLSVGMARLLEQCPGLRQFTQCAQIHHRNTAAEMFDHRQVVCDKHIGKRALLPGFHQQVEYLRLDGYI